MTAIALPPERSYLTLTDDDLPSSDEIPMDNPRQRRQMELLIDPLCIEWKNRTDVYVSGDMFVYFSPDRRRYEDFRGPDVLIATGVLKRERKSWVVWDEGKAPDVVIEVLSETSEPIDRGLKKEVYQNKLKVPEYYWHDPFDPSKFTGHRLERGRYVPINQNPPGCITSRALGLSLVLWHGVFADIHTTWARWARLDGTLLPTAEEISLQAIEQLEAERQRADHERQIAEREREAAQRERQRAERLEAMIRELGIEVKE